MSNITSNISRIKKTLQGGVDKVYLFPYVDYSWSQIVVDGQYLTSFPDTTIFDLYSVSTNYTENTELEGGATVWNQSFSVEFPKMSVGTEIYKYSFKDYRAIYIDRNGNIRILGLYNGLEATITQETGNGKSDFSGYRVSFSGKEDNQAFWINNLIDVGFDVNTFNNYVFESGCNYIFESGENYIFE